MKENKDYKKLLFWEKAKFWTRIFFFILILIALVSVYIRAGGDPCEACQLKIDANGISDTYNCREVIDEFVLPKFQSNAPTKEYDIINASKYAGLFNNTG